MRSTRSSHTSKSHNTSQDVTPSVRELLSNEAWYGHGLVTYDHMMTPNEALENNISTIKLLRKRGSDEANILRIARRLTRCAEGRRCLSAACPMCSRAFQRAFVNLAQDAFTRAGYVPNKLRFVSLVNHRWLVPRGQLTGDNVRTIVRHATDVLARAKIDLFIGGFDLSANWDENDKAASQYQCQLAGLVDPETWSQGQSQLKRAFPKTTDTLRPVHTQAFDGKAEALAYCLKPTFHGRETYVDQNECRADRGPSRNSRGRPLHVKERLEVLAMLDEIGLAKRAVIRGARFVLTKTGPRMTIHVQREPMNDLAKTDQIRSKHRN